MKTTAFDCGGFELEPNDEDPRQFIEEAKLAIEAALQDEHAFGYADQILIKSALAYLNLIEATRSH